MIFICCYLLAAAGTALGLLIVHSDDYAAPKSKPGKVLWSIGFGLIWPFTLALGITVAAKELE